MKYRGVYLVTEASIAPGSGAKVHIDAGIDQLGRHFELHPWFVGPRRETAARASAKGSRTMGTGLPSAIRRSSLAGAARDCRAYVRQARLYGAINAHVAAVKPDFIYERAGFGSFAGLRIARRCGIKHFYEINGIASLDMLRHYDSAASQLNLRFELNAYTASDFSFFMGTWGDYARLPTPNWMNIENGVDEGFIESFSNHEKPLSCPVRICFIGHVMAHHRFDVVIESLNQIPPDKAWEFHVVGRMPDDVAQIFRMDRRLYYHGVVDRPHLAEILRRMHVGVASADVEYGTGMKTFDYGAAKLLVLAPDNHNTRYWFSDDEIMRYPMGSVEGLAQKLTTVIENPELIDRFGSTLHGAVKSRFTWPIVFQQIAGRMVNIIESTSARRSAR